MQKKKLPPIGPRRQSKNLKYQKVDRCSRHASLGTGERKERLRMEYVNIQAAGAVECRVVF